MNDERGNDRGVKPQVGFADMVAFGCELAMFVVLIVAVNHLVDGWRSWLIGIAWAIVVAGVWARWMAPRSAHRLVDPWRYLAQAVLFVAVGALAALAGLLVLAGVFTVTSLVAFAFSRTEQHAV